MSTQVATPLAGTTTATAARAAVPWSTVIALGVVLAYSSGFWITSLREAVGAIERTSDPFSAWLRESTFLLPLYLLGVLAALALARKRYGPTLRGRTLLEGVLLVAAAATAVAVLELGVSSIFDYRLQMQHLNDMGTMGGLCFEECVQSQKDATLALQLKSVGIGSVILLASNVIVVLWSLAFMGGRLRVERAARGSARERSAARDLQVVVAASLVGSAVVHLAVVPEHLREWETAGLFFVLLAVMQLATADLVMAHLSRRVLVAASALSAGTLALWAWSRAFGLPFAPDAGAREPVGLADLTAGLLELATIVCAVLLLRLRDLPRRKPLTAHGRALAVVAVVAVTTMGVGAGLAMYGSASEGGGHGHAETTQEAHA